MKTVTLPTEKWYEVLRYVSSDESLHATILDALLNKKNDYYHNTTGVGPEWIPCDIKDDTQRTLKDFIASDMVRSVKTLRHNYNLPLKDAKDIYDCIKDLKPVQR